MTCPVCGLVLTVKRTKGGTRLSYDTREWKRLCKRPDLDSPVLCLLQGSREGGRDDSNGNPAE